MSKVANTEAIDAGINAGEVGADNKVDVQGKSECDCTFLSGCLHSFIECLTTTRTGGLGHNTSLGNTTDITAGVNTEKGRIGAENEYKIKGE